MIAAACLRRSSGKSSLATCLSIRSIPECQHTLSARRFDLFFSELFPSCCLAKKSPLSLLEVFAQTATKAGRVAGTYAIGRLCLCLCGRHCNIRPTSCRSDLKRNFSDLSDMHFDSYNFRGFVYFNWLVIAPPPFFGLSYLPFAHYWFY